MFELGGSSSPGGFKLTEFEFAGFYCIQNIQYTFFEITLYSKETATGRFRKAVTSVVCVKKTKVRKLYRTIRCMLRFSLISNQ